MGIEKAQITYLADAFRGINPPPLTDHSLSNPNNKTPNQYAMARAISLISAPTPGDTSTAITDCLTLLRDMRRYGHMATGPHYHNEQMAPDPHTGLWYAAISTITRWALQHGVVELVDVCREFWRVHFHLCRVFWTPQGPRLPCARAKAAPGRALVPVWGIDTLACSRILGLVPSHRPQVDTLTVDILTSNVYVSAVNVSKSFLDSLAEPTSPLSPLSLTLGVPLLYWPRDSGGYIAALDYDVEMNDRCSWMEVDRDGSVIGAGSTLDTLPPVDGNPTVVGLQALDAQPNPSTHRATLPSNPTLPVPSTTTTNGGDDGTKSPGNLPTPLVDIATSISKLLLPRREHTLQTQLVEELIHWSSATSRPLSAIVSDVQSLSIGDHQKQKADQLRIVSDLRKRGEVG